MKFDELLKRHNESTELMKFVDDDPYKKYDNIVDAYHDAKQFRPKDVDSLTFYSELMDYLEITYSFDDVLNTIYKSHPNGDLTDDNVDNSLMAETENGNKKSVYRSVYTAAMRQGKQFMTSRQIHNFVEQFNELAKRVNDQASK